MRNWQKVLSDYGIAFLSCMITAYMAIGKSVFDLGVDGWKAVVSAAIASFLPVVYVALSKNNARYGITIPQNEKKE